MKTFTLILFVLFIVCCSHKASSKSDINRSLTDTVFLKRVVRDIVYMDITNHAYNAVYIDTNRNSAYYKQIADFSFDKYENMDYYNIEFKKRDIHLKKQPSMICLQNGYHCIYIRINTIYTHLVTGAI